MKLLLASNSPRRRELLRNAGLNFDVVSSGFEEDSPRHGESPEQYSRRLAHSKAASAAVNAPEGSVVLGADTIVTIEGQVLGKPADLADAVRMLRLLAGKTHEVITAVCLMSAPDRLLALEHETTSVTFGELSEEEIRAYVTSEEPFDKAGAYGIQGLASKFVTRINGCYFNVVGLPVPRLYGILKHLGVLLENNS